MVNQKLPCPCQKCRFLKSAWSQTRKSHVHLYGITEPQSKKVSNDLPASDDVADGIMSPTSAFDTVNCEPTQRTAPTPRKRIRGDAFEEPPSVDPIDPISDLAVVIMRNKGRPLGVGLIQKILKSIHPGFQKGEMPLTAVALQKRAVKQTVHSAAKFVSAELEAALNLDLEPKTVRVCGACFLYRFDVATASNSITCDDCGLVIITCQNDKCKRRCVELSRKSRIQRPRTCCGIGPKSPRIVAAHMVSSFTSIIQSFFAQRDRCMDLLAPFLDITGFEGDYLSTTLGFV